MLKQYYFDKPMFFTYPGGCSLKVADFGVLQKYIGNYYSKTEMDRIIADMMLKHPYVSGAYELNINISKVVDANTSEYYHMLTFKNDNCEKQEKGSKVLYEDEFGNIDIEKLLDKFDEKYELLYVSDTVLPNYYDLVQVGDEFIKNNSDVVAEFVKLRGDFISSDREIVAFVMALNDLVPSATNTMQTSNKTYKDVLEERKKKIEAIDRDCDTLLEQEYLDDMVKDIRYHLCKILKGEEESNFQKECLGYFVPEMSYSLGGKIATILTEEMGTKIIGYNNEINNWQTVGNDYWSGRYVSEKTQKGVLFQMIDKLPDFEFSKEELAEMEAHQRIFG